MARSMASRNWSSLSGGGAVLLVFDPPQDTLIIAAFSNGYARTILPNRASTSRRLRGNLRVKLLIKMFPKQQDKCLTIIATRCG
jgi:hypothetical protein